MRQFGLKCHRSAHSYSLPQPAEPGVPHLSKSVEMYTYWTHHTNSFQTYPQRCGFPCGILSTALLSRQSWMFICYLLWLCHQFLFGSYAKCCFVCLFLYWWLRKYKEILKLIKSVLLSLVQVAIHTRQIHYQLRGLAVWESFVRLNGWIAITSTLGPAAYIHRLEITGHFNKWNTSHFNKVYTFCITHLICSILFYCILVYAALILHGHIFIYS